MIGKPLRIDQTLYVFENDNIWNHYPLVPFSVFTFAIMPVHPRPNFPRYYGNRINEINLGLPKKLWVLYIWLFTFGEKILSLQGQMGPKSLHLHFFGNHGNIFQLWWFFVRHLPKGHIHAKYQVSICDERTTIAGVKHLVKTGYKTLQCPWHDIKHPR